MKPGQNKAKLIRILLMEDESTVANLIKLHLQGRGYSVDIAQDGYQGLRMAQPEAYDLLLIDQKMPEMSGTDVIRELKQRGPLPPVLMISALGREEVAVEAMKLGALDYVIKDGGNRFLQNLPAVIDDARKRHLEAEHLRRHTEDRTRWLHEMKQRVKELGCLYGMERLFAGENPSLEAALGAVADLIPNACRHDTLCWARIHVHVLDVHSKGYRETAWKQPFVIKEMGRAVGALEVGYREQPPGAGTDLFSPEETQLLTTIAERLGQFIDRWFTQQRLRETHQELRKLSRAVEQSASAILITDSNGNIEYVNPQFTKVTGYEPAEVIGQNPRFLKSGERSLEEYRQLWETILGGGEWRGEFRNRKKNGELYWEFASISPVFDSKGAVTHFVAVKEEITRRKEEELLRNAVLALSADIAGCHTEDEICRVVVEEIRARMNVDRCALFLGDPNHPPFRGTYGTDMEGRTTDEHEVLWHIQKGRDGADLFAEGSYKTGFPLGAPEQQPGEEGLASTLIPLRQSNDIFGVISIDHRISRRPISEAQIMHIALLAEVIGNALQVARAREALRTSVETSRRANEELEAFNRAMVGREARVIEMKEEVNRLLAELGRPPRYEPVWNAPDKPVRPGGAP